MTERPPSFNLVLPRELLDRLNAICARRLIGRTLVITRAIEEVVTWMESEEERHTLRIGCPECTQRQPASG